MPWQHSHHSHLITSWHKSWPNLQLCVRGFLFHLHLLLHCRNSHRTETPRAQHRLNWGRVWLSLGNLPPFPMQSGLQIVEIQLRSMISKDCFDVLVALANNKESASNVSTECNQLTLSLFPIFSTARRLTSLQHKHTSVYPTVFGIIRKNTIRIDSNYFTLLVMANATPSVLQNLKLFALIFIVP